MKIKFKSFGVSFLVLLVPLISLGQGFFTGPHTTLSRAHEAYLKGDLKTMALSLKQALEENPEDALVKENVLSLLQKSYEATGASEFQVDWRLPDEIKFLRVGSKRMLKDDVSYRFRVYGATAQSKTIAQFQVIQFPDHVILDKKAGIGEWDENPDPLSPASHEFGFESKMSRIPVASGLYFLNIKLVDGTQTKGWFILNDDVNSTANPNVTSPSADQVFKTENPSFNWQAFTSPQCKAFERRSMWVGVFRSEAPNYDWTELWGHFEKPPVHDQVTVDAYGDGLSVTKLEPGHYIFFIDVHEQRRFGDLDITRDSGTVRNFTVIP